MVLAIATMSVRKLSATGLMTALLATPTACHDRGGPNSGAEPTTSPSRDGERSFRFVPQARRSATAPHGERASDARKRKRRRQLRVAPVFIDGVPLGVLSHKELPPDFAPNIVMRGEPFSIYSLTGYLSYIGATLSKIREVHLMGGSRPSIIDGDELRRMKDHIHFAFSRGDGGRPRMDWPAERVKSWSRIDRIVAIYVYENEPAPRFDPTRRQFFDAHGKAIEGIPYAKTMRALKGTRLYLDGKFLGALRRRDLDETIRGEDTKRGEPTYRLGPYLKKMGAAVDPAVIEFIAQDRVVGRLDRKGYKKLASRTRFTLPRRSRGRMHIRMVEAMSPSPGGVALTAIQMYDKRTAPSRAVVAPKSRPTY